MTDTHSVMWPTPDEAYAEAPSMVREINWTAGEAADRPFGGLMPREFWLRKAALLDRIALAGTAGNAFTDPADVAEMAAQRLMDLDGAPPNCSPRHYVRQQYARWAQTERAERTALAEERAALLAAGRCPNCQWLDYQCGCADHPDA